MATQGKRRQPEVILEDIPEAWWSDAFKNAWVPYALRSGRRYEAELVGRRLRIAAALDAVLKRESRLGDLPWPYKGLWRAVQRWARGDRELKKGAGESWRGTERSRGRESRLTAFVRYMFGRHPELPRTPGPWVRACDQYGSPEVDWAPPAMRGTWASAERAAWDRRRRDLWKSLLRRCAGAK